MRSTTTFPRMLALACATMLSACAAPVPETPTDADVQAVAREHLRQQVNEAGLEGDERAAFEAAVAAATFAPGARCVAGAGEVYACEQDTTIAMPGEDRATQLLILELVRHDGAWRAAP